MADDLQRIADQAVPLDPEQEAEAAKAAAAQLGGGGGGKKNKLLACIKCVMFAVRVCWGHSHSYIPGCCFLRCSEMRAPLLSSRHGCPSWGRR